MSFSTLKPTPFCNESLRTNALYVIFPPNNPTPNRVLGINSYPPIKINSCHRSLCHTALHEWGSTQGEIEFDPGFLPFDGISDRLEVRRFGFRNWFGQRWGLTVFGCCES
ncbi:hypothetical protein CEXT_640471 [Caerostris extrusa]|uniref:Uncharacterized protein n=1 Tax=Caerostris extrusa TaxID=172846 RepID=A0AAV4WR92_CAEEX|nr:hypothetical protein CEXT_640471 [Caerostris extrusa]